MDTLRARLARGRGRYGTRYEPHFLEVEVEVEKAEGGIRVEALAPHTQGWDYNKLLDIWRMTRRDEGSSSGGIGERGPSGGSWWSTSARG